MKTGRVAAAAPWREVQNASRAVPRRSRPRAGLLASAALVVAGLVVAALPVVAAAEGLASPASASAKDRFAGCLLTMDDNFRTIEWLAYHYHTLPLRRLIVMVDPRSKTSPAPILERWGDRMEIDLWTDRDVFSYTELHNGTDEGDVRLHRTRQRAFNVQCMKALRDEGARWTLMTDVDEYLYINPRAWDPTEPLYQERIAPISIEEPGSVLQMLGRVDMSDERVHAGEWQACLPVSRLQFGGAESLSEEVDNQFPEGLAPTLLAHDLDTFRWRHHGVDAIAASAGIMPGKTIVDLSAVPDEEAQRSFTGNPHRPIAKLCHDVWPSNRETLFLANHVLGTKQQYASRDDSRLVNRVLAWEGRKNVGGSLSDEVRPWLAGFVKDVGIKEARRLLANAGQVQVAAQAVDLPRCAINLFGLPRSFKTMALPSIVKNVLLTNAKYNCDIFVHYYKIAHDRAGRFNEGGDIDAESIHALKDVTEIVAAHAGWPAPAVVIVGETEDQFSDKYGDLVNRYQTATDPDTGVASYFRGADKSYKSTDQLKNIFMQWNSIQTAWDVMTDHANGIGIEYERVAFLRSDAFYALPVDIYQLDKDTYDYDNSYAIVPAFAKHPMNDRMMYGPADAVKIWATERFERLEHHVATHQLEGYGMHSERFLAHEILSAIKRETGHEIIENADICFYRTRASDRVMITDCSIGGSTRGILDLNQVKLVEDLVNRPCKQVPLDNIGRVMELRCDELAEMDSMAVSRRNLQFYYYTGKPITAPVPGAPSNSVCDGPLGDWNDGYCHDELNTEACGYDGGDCCPSTCNVGNPFGLCVYTSITDCVDPHAEENGGLKLQVNYVEGDVEVTVTGAQPGSIIIVWVSPDINPFVIPDENDFCPGLEVDLAFGQLVSQQFIADNDGQVQVRGFDKHGRNLAVPDPVAICSDLFQAIEVVQDSSCRKSDVVFLQEWRPVFWDTSTCSEHGFQWCTGFACPEPPGYNNCCQPSSFWCDVAVGCSADHNGTPDDTTGPDVCRAYWLAYDYFLSVSGLTASPISASPTISPRPTATVSSNPSGFPTVSSQPTAIPSSTPSDNPSVSLHPSTSLIPTREPCEEGLFSLELQTDDFGSETSWKLYYEDGSIIISGNGYGDNQLYEIETCIDTGCHSFRISDYFGDGICCLYGQGYYTARVDGDVVGSGGGFTTEDRVNFCY